MDDGAGVGPLELGVRRQDDAVSTEFGRLFPYTRESRGRYVDSRGWDAGRRAADRAVFTKGRISA
jgi:hypothetical protein